jgi:hypothetical protein
MSQATKNEMAKLAEKIEALRAEVESLRAEVRAKQTRRPKKYNLEASNGQAING